MKKKPDIEKNLQDLYDDAKIKQKACPHCGAMIEQGGDPADLLRIIDRQLDLMKIQAKMLEDGGGGTPDSLKD